MASSQWACASLPRGNSALPLGPWFVLNWSSVTGMSKTALLFAGQGAQTVGMGKDFAERFALARELFDRANSVVGFDLASVCFSGPDEELMQTRNAQPGIYVVSW